MPVFSALGQDCLLCGASSDASLVCGACDSALPRAGMGCARCAAPLAAPGVCGECLGHPPAFDAALAAFEYRFPLDRLVQRFKYSADLAAGRWLASQLLGQVAAAPRPDILVAPPLTAARLRGRGFNQSIELAKVVARGLRLSWAPAALRRLRDTAPQPGLGRRARRENLRGAFACAESLRGRAVAIVDDVITTGATADAMARVLKRAGACRVDVWAVARTP